MQVEVLFFALAREKAGRSTAAFALDDAATVAELWRAIVHEHPGLEPLGSSVSFAVNQEYADRRRVLRDGDEVAVIPPVSGG